MEVRTPPPLMMCMCGAAFRTLLDGHTPVRVDEHPVPGGNLIVNVNEIIGHVRPGTARMERELGHLGYRVHRCRRRPS